METKDEQMAGMAEHGFVIPHGGGADRLCEQCGHLASHPVHNVPPGKCRFRSGTTSTKRPRLSLIPHQGLVNAAIRFEVGLARHGDKAWSALSGNQEALRDDEWLIERCSHAVEHLYSLIDHLKTRSTASSTEAVQAARGHAGAVAWCGLVLGEALGADYDGYQTSSR